MTVLPVPLLVVPSVLIDVSRSMPFAALNLAVGAVTFTDPPLPSVSAPMTDLSHTEFVAVTLPTAKSLFLVSVTSVNVVPSVPDDDVYSVVTVRLPVPFTVVPADCVKELMVAAALNVVVPDETSISGTSKLLLKLTAPAFPKAPVVIPLVCPTATPNVLAVVASELIVPSLMIDPVPDIVAFESDRVPSFWNRELSVKELLSAPLLLAETKIDPAPPIVPPLQPRLPLAPATERKLPPLSVPPDTVSPSLNVEAFVTVSAPPAGIVNGLSAVTLRAEAFSTLTVTPLKPLPIVTSYALLGAKPISQLAPSDQLAPSPSPVHSSVPRLGHEPTVTLQVKLPPPTLIEPETPTVIDEAVTVRSLAEVESV